MWHFLLTTECGMLNWNDNYYKYISKEYFRPGGMAPSEWMRSVRAVRDTSVADYPTPGVNSTPRVPDHPLIAISPFLLVRSVSYIKWSLRRCGQLWPSVRMGSLGTRLHRDCNAMGDAAKISPRVPSTCTQNAILFLLIIHIIWGRQIYVAIDSPSLIPSVSCLTTSSYLWNDMSTANNISHTENLQSNGWLYFSQFYKIRNGIQVTRVFRYCGEHQGQPVLNETSILV